MRLLLVSSLLVMALTSTVYAGEPFAVVEMFGSEGCSSCPPADDVLRELTRISRAQNLRIFTLSFHVDYWNNLGWADPYSQAQFTQRQYQYAEVFHSLGVYTPQMIVNGTSEFVGSKHVKAGQEIEQALQNPSFNDVFLKIKKSDAGAVEVDYNCEQFTDHSVLNFAFVERGLESHVTRGENAGNTLKHDNVVRVFKTLPFTKMEGTVSFDRPAGNDLSRFSVIVYVQDTTTMKILAANSIDLH